jgi:hypothetical protein
LEKAKAVQPRVADVRNLLDLYRVTDTEQREALFELTREARKRGWWTEFGQLDDNFVDFEAEASKIFTWQPIVIPGLLQTPEYARAIQRGYLMTDEKEIDKLVRLRMERQHRPRGPDTPGQPQTPGPERTRPPRRPACRSCSNSASGSTRYGWPS